MGSSDKPNGRDDSVLTAPSSGASKTTAFSASIQKFVLPLAITILGSYLGSPIYLAAIPYLVIMKYMVKPEPAETSLQWYMKYAILQVFYCGFLLVASMGVLLPVLGLKITGYHALAFYIPMMTISLHDQRYQYGFLGTLVLQIFFDIPLVAAGYVCREFFGLRIMAPFCNIFDDTIVQGSMPFPSDIATLASEPYNVGLIVNMCREYSGATNEMKKFGIVQCHLPHQDTTAVSFESLVSGCAYIRQFKKHNPMKRVFIHCKGGIARASTMSLAHFVFNEDQDPEVAIMNMKSKRPIIFVGVKDFPAILRLNEERLSKQIQEDSKLKPKKL